MFIQKYLRVISALKDEERIATEKLRLYELDHTRGLKTRERKKNYKENDEALKILVQNFDGMENPTDDQLVDFLRSIQYRLMKNNFDNWDDYND
jgi:CRISPR/Cas system CSM-associated protein Csm2 small subunit